jgi:hypothetical protein
MVFFVRNLLITGSIYGLFKAHECHRGSPSTAKMQTADDQQLSGQAMASSGENFTIPLKTRFFAWVFT